MEEIFVKISENPHLAIKLFGVVILQLIFSADIFRDISVTIDVYRKTDEPMREPKKRLYWLKKWAKLYFIGKEKGWHNGTIRRLGFLPSLFFGIIQLVPCLVSFFAAYLDKSYPNFNFLFPINRIAIYQIVMGGSGALTIYCWYRYYLDCTQVQKAQEKFCKLIKDGQTQKPSVSEKDRKMIQFIWAWRNIFSFYGWLIFTIKILVMFSIVEIEWKILPYL